jgi:hypothetical protein
MLFTFSKEFKTSILDSLEHWCHNQRVSSKSIGIYLRSFHLNAPLYIIIAVVLAPKIIADIAAIEFALAFLFFYLFQGCWLSMLESRLCKDSFTIADPFLELFGYEVNRETRNISTCLIMAYFLVIFVAVYYYRFVRE